MNFGRQRLLTPTLLLVGLLLSSVAVDAKSPAKPPDLSACGGNEWTGYIGKPVETLRQKNPVNTRFVCEKECVVTADYRSDRLNVIYSNKTNLVLSMHCG